MTIGLSNKTRGRARVLSRILHVAGLRWTLSILAITLVRTSACFAQNSPNSPAKPQPGLQAVFSVGSPPDAIDLKVLPNIELYVPENEPPTPFLPAGKFTVRWTGFLAADLRSECSMTAELNGSLKVQINGTSVLEGSGNQTNLPPSALFRLNKGANAIVAEFRNTTPGPAFVRLQLIPKGGFAAPIPLSLLSHSPSEALYDAARLHLGRELFIEHRCHKCHQLAPGTPTLPELEMDAPAFAGIGSRRTPAWMAEWISDPGKLRSKPSMPALFHGPTASADATAVATFLSTLKADGTKEPILPPAPTPDQIESGQRLFEVLNCAGCHLPPGGKEADPARISLQNVGAKFAPGALNDFLRKPNEFYARIRMPRFNFTEREAGDVAAFILGNLDTAKP